MREKLNCNFFFLSPGLSHNAEAVCPQWTDCISGIRDGSCSGSLMCNVKPCVVIFVPGRMLETVPFKIYVMAFSTFSARLENDTLAVS